MDSFESAVKAAYQSAVAGNLVVASDVVSRLRSLWSIESSSQAAIEVMLVEGVIHIYSGRTQDGVERLRRVHAIGDVVGDLNLSSLARGWLSLVNYNSGDVLSAGRLLSEALTGRYVAESRTILRLSTVAGLLCEYIDQTSSASQWLAASQIAARRTETPGALSSVIYDLATAAIDSAVAKRLSGALSSKQANQLKLRVASAVNYDDRTGGGVQKDLHWLALGMISNICEQYAEAERYILRYMCGVPSYRAADHVCAKIELAIAQSQGGMLAVPQPLVESIQIGIDSLVEPTERAMAFDILSRDRHRNGMMHESEVLRERMRSEIRKRNELSRSLEALLRAESLLFPPASWLVGSLP